jgi:molybdopterin converting factor small subunit
MFYREFKNQSCDYRSHNMIVRFHFYSISKEIAGIREMPLDVSNRATLGDALDALYATMPDLRSLSASCLFAVGTNYAPKETILSEGDEISMIPPMQGG